MHQVARNGVIPYKTVTLITTDERASNPARSVEITEPKQVLPLAGGGSLWPVDITDATLFRIRQIGKA
jgi:hypothetical protein